MDDGAPVAEEFAGFLAALAALPFDAAAPQPDLAEMRASAAALRVPLNRGGPVMAATREIALDGPAGAMRTRIHQPETDEHLPALLYLHGGGWVLLDIDTHDRLMREYASASGRTVIGIDYPLAPEHGFPVPVQACAAALTALALDGAAPGIDSARIAIGGDSAGANLALATALLLRERGGPMPEALLLNYGVFDSSLSQLSYREFAAAPGPLTTEKMAWFWSQYCPKDRRDDALAAPLCADLAGLPPVRIVIAGRDVLRDENRAMAAALRHAGGEVEVEEVAAAPHGFLEATALCPSSLAVVEHSADWLRKIGRSHS